jgi:ribosomal protein S27AE
MSKGSKRPGWRTVEARYKRISRDLQAAAEAARAASIGPCGTFTGLTRAHYRELYPEAIATAQARNRDAAKFPDWALCDRCGNSSVALLTPRADGGWSTICRACITLDDRWFCGKFPCGLVYADRAIEVHGDYKRVAFLPYSSLELEIDDPNSPLIERVKADAAAMQARRGQPYQIAGNMTITLGDKHV